MVNHQLTENKKEIIHKILGIIFIIVGVIFYITPIPGTTFLIIIGFVLLIGEKRTLHFLKRILGDKIFKSLKIKSIVKKI